MQIPLRTQRDAVAVGLRRRGAIGARRPKRLPSPCELPDPLREEGCTLTVREHPLSKCRSRERSGGNREHRGRRRGSGAAGRPLLLPGGRSAPHQARTPGSARDAEDSGPRPHSRPHTQQNTKPFAAGLRTPRPKAPPLTSDPGSPISPTA